jgi:hypothetical protein
VNASSTTSPELVQTMTGTGEHAGSLEFQGSTLDGQAFRYPGPAAGSPQPISTPAAMRLP